MEQNGENGKDGKKWGEQTDQGTFGENGHHQGAKKRNAVLGTKLRIQYVVYSIRNKQRNRENMHSRDSREEGCRLRKQQNGENGHRREKIKRTA